MIAIKWTPVCSAIDAKSHLAIREEGKEQRAGAIYSSCSSLVSRFSSLSLSLSFCPNEMNFALSPKFLVTWSKESPMLEVGSWMLALSSWLLDQMQLQSMEKGKRAERALRDCTLRTLERALDSWRSNFQPDQVTQVACVITLGCVGTSLILAHCSFLRIHLCTIDLEHLKAWLSHHGKRVERQVLSKKSPNHR